MNWITRMRTAVRAFREAYVTADALDAADFEDYGGRMLRYQMLWAWYENTAYRNIHKWAEAYRSEYGLYKYIRNIYNPAYRLAEFWKTVVFGGLLNEEAGEDGAIPILTPNDGLRSAIATLWADSDWDVNKDTLVTWGSALGDVAIKIVDDVEREQMRLETIHPSIIKELIVDSKGYVKGYQLEEQRMYEGKKVIYCEYAERELGTENVVFSTTMDGKLFPWNGKTGKWTEPYGFIPLVAIQHNRVGFNFGWAEVHPLRSKVNEVDDLASKLHDYIRKYIDPVWLFNFAKPRVSPQIHGGEATTDRPQPGREEMPSLYIPNSAAKGQPLVTDLLDIEKVAKEISNVLAEMERDFPELQMDIWTAGGYTTGKALKTARQRVERKVIQRRPNYDKGLTRAHQMAIAIGGMNGYAGYEGYDLTSFKKGLLDHKIPSDRKIFDADSTAEIQDKQIFWNIVVQAMSKGISPVIILTDLGWGKKKIDDFMKEMQVSGKLPSTQTPPVEGQTPPDSAGNPPDPVQNTATPDPSGTLGQLPQ